MFLQGVIRKRRKDNKDVGLKSLFHRDTKLRRVYKAREGDPPKEGPRRHRRGSTDPRPRPAGST
jgi:hypothetical protein